MDTSAYIPKERILLPAQDFHFLREEGLKLIEKLGSKLWTDYNHHDPGITILDVLAYAITELGYRTDFAIEDLLTGKNGAINNKTFFTPARILTNAPLTVLDYRKLLIDIEGISNAWLLPYRNTKNSEYSHLPHEQEIALYFDTKTDKLTLSETNIFDEKLEKLTIKGLNKVIIELDDDPELGDLNDLFVDTAFWHKNRWIDVRAVSSVSSWNDPNAKLFKLLNSPPKISIGSVEEKEKSLLIRVLRYSNNNQHLDFEITPFDKSELEFAKDFLSKEAGICSIIKLFEKKKEKIDATFKAVFDRLQDNRNLTDDFFQPEVVEKISVSICADIRINSEKDAAHIFSKIRQAIDEIINPGLKFYTLSELLDEGKATEEIFSGPRLQHGFIKDEELLATGLAEGIHASDIIAAIMAIEGVEAVGNFLMTAYDKNGKPIDGAKNEPWVLNLDGDKKAVFDTSGSKILLFRNNIPFLLTEQQQKNAGEDYLSNQVEIKNQKLLNSRNDFELPKGEYYQLDQYYSIQNDFPATYKIGKNEVLEKGSDLRKAQSKQLKAYLYFYEQLIADFFSQLHHAGDLLDIGNISNSYFTNPVDKFTEDDQHLYYRELFAESLTSLFAAATDEENISVAESKTQFYKRRNAALDHLLARFSESFNEYVYAMYQLSSGRFGIEFDEEAVVKSKEQFLSIYPEISSKRGLGINYHRYRNNPDFLNPDYRGGFEKRTAGMLGITNLDLRNIVTEPVVQTQWTVELPPPDKHYIFKIMNPEINLVEKWNWSQHHFLENDNYNIIKYGAKYFCYLVNDEERIARLDDGFDTLQEAEQALSAMIKKLNAHYENFYCMEHILLRPFNNENFEDKHLLPVCLKACTGPTEHADPYSAKATIILPGYLLRFKSLAFRKFAEDIFRKEASAHVLLKICWVGYHDMIQFQKTYKNWILLYGQYREALFNQKVTKTLEKKYAKALEELLAAMQELNNIYPEGTLYDCQRDEMDNPIVLGQTSLGSLKNN